MLQGECRTSSSLIRRRHRRPPPHSSPIGHPVDRRSDRVHGALYVCVAHVCILCLYIYIYVRTKKQLITTRSVRRRACVCAPVHRVLFGNITVLLSSPEKNVYYSMAEDHLRCPNIMHSRIHPAIIYLYDINMMGGGTSQRKRRGKHIACGAPTVRVAAMRGRGRNGRTEINARADNCSRCIYGICAPICTYTIG